ncbi:MAG: glycosyltransferase family 9 protein [Bacteroidota bacterium]
MKILIVRFSSIGDIVLTSTTVRCVKQQTKAEVHFLTKARFRAVVEHNPYIDRVWTMEKDLKEVVKDLKAERFDLVLDLHNNLRCWVLSWHLRKSKFYRFSKLNTQKWLLTRWKINRLPDIHIVDRYLATASSLGVKNDGQGLDYFPGEATADFIEAGQAWHSQPYLAFVIGAAHATKCLTEEQMIDFCRAFQQPILLLGGPAEKEQGERIATAAGHHVHSTCGQFTLHESAMLVRDAAAVLTHDTGLMHIAAAFDKPIISVWGNTVADFGMYPYLPRQKKEERERRIAVTGLSCRPCSKIGFSACPQGHFRCIRDIQITDIMAKTTAILADNQGS